MIDPAAPEVERAAPDAASGAAPDAASGAAPDAASGAAPGAASGAAPGAGPEAGPGAGPEAGPGAGPGAGIDRALQQLARTIVQHPLAAQAAYAALVREGRAFAATDEGARLRRQLAGSELAARLRTAWQLVTLGMLRDDAAPGAIPSVLIDALVQAALRDRFEARLRDALVGKAGEP